MKNATDHATPNITLCRSGKVKSILYEVHVALDLTRPNITFIWTAYCLLLTRHNHNQNQHTPCLNRNAKNGRFVVFTSMDVYNLLIILRKKGRQIKMYIQFFTFEFDKKRNPDLKHPDLFFQTFCIQDVSTPDLFYSGPFVTGPFEAGSFVPGPFEVGPFKAGSFVGEP